ncbi:MAG TPA: DUF2127 domain-containing protein [Stenomitos sp.]
MHRHSPGLLAIIGYKTLTGIALSVIAVAIVLTVRHYSELQDWSESLVLAGQQGSVSWIVEHLAQLRRRTLAFSAVVACVYAGLSLTEAIGLWYKQVWAHWLVLVSIGLGIPAEIYELHHHFSWLKLTIFLFNLLIFAYMFRYGPKMHHRP